MNIGAMSLSGHKIHGPKGIGALFVARAHQRKLRAQMIGGGQQRNMRSGTLATPLIAGLGKACAVAREVYVDENERLHRLSETLLRTLEGEGIEYRLLGPRDLHRRRPGSLCLAVEGLDATRLCEWIPEVALSQGSACNSRGVGSHVLRALGLGLEEAKTVVRVAFGRLNHAGEARLIGAALAEVVRGRGRRPGPLAGAAAAAPVVAGGETGLAAAL
jgi:cysteine desulfurase